MQVLGKNAKTYKIEMIKMGLKKESERAPYHDYIYRQAKGLPWTDKPAYSIGLLIDNDLVKKGLDYKRDRITYDQVEIPIDEIDRWMG